MTHSVSAVEVKLSKSATRLMKAVTGFSQMPQDASNLKRLALFFDHIYCIAPHLTIIKEELVDDLMAKRQEGARAKLDYFDQTRKAVWLPLRSVGGETGELVAALQDRDLLTEVNQEAPPIVNDSV